MLCISLGLEAVIAWGKKFNIMRHGYSGGGWDGNNSKKILDNVDNLRHHMPNSLEIMPAIDALQALKPVIDGEWTCFLALSVGQSLN